MAKAKSNVNNIKQSEEEKKELVGKKEEIVEKEEKQELEEVKQNEKDKEIENLKQQMTLMQQMLNQFMSMQNTGSVQNSTNEDVVIGCRVLQGVGFSDQTIGDISFEFNELQTISNSDMKIYLRNANVKKLFEDGLCYFEDNKNYDVFNIRTHIDLSDENILRILSGEDINLIVRRLNDITNGLRNSNVVNCIVFRICDLIIKKKLSLSYYVQKNLEDYFHYEFNRGIVTLNMLNNLK